MHDASVVVRTDVVLVRLDLHKVALQLHCLHLRQVNSNIRIPVLPRLFVHQSKGVPDLVDSGPCSAVWCKVNSVDTS